jgi:ribosomal protein S18 acetylase RimI-like enzyme
MQIYIKSYHMDAMISSRIKNSRPESLSTVASASGNSLLQGGLRCPIHHPRYHYYSKITKRYDANLKCIEYRQRERVILRAQLENDSQTRELSDDFTVMSSDGLWRIRKIQRDDLEEIKRIVELQAEGFHTPHPLPFIDGFLKTSFKAEVLSEMQKKIKYNPSHRFVCLIVEPVGQSNPVGVVEISYIDEKEVLQSLEPDTQGVVYIASMTVSSAVRRQGAARALLEAAERVTKEWDEDKCVLHVYQDNTAAIDLYKKQGFETIFGDAAWLAKVAVRPRYLMKKAIE